MESKLIFLLVFVSLVKGAYVPTLKVDYGLSEEEADVLQKIMVSQELTLATFSVAWKTLFEAIFDLEAEIDDLCQKIHKALVRAKAALDVILDAYVLALGKCCSPVVEIARKKTHADFHDTFARRIATAVRSIGFGNHSVDRTAIETQHTAAKKNYKNLVDVEYGIIYTCLNTTDAETRSVIRSVQKQALVIAIHIINAAFNAVKVYAAAVPVSCGDESFTFDIKDLRNKILTGLRTYVEYEFGLLRTLYINSRLNQCGIVSGVAQSQYTEIVSFLEFVEGNIGVFGIATSYLKRIDLGLSDDEDDRVFSATNVSLAKITAVYDIGDNIILDFILFIHPDASAEIATAREYLHAVNVEGNIAFVDAFAVAAARDRNHSEILDSIEILKNAIVSTAPDYTQYIFNLIRNNQTFDQKTEAELTTLQNVTLQGAVINNLKFFDAAVILANASYAGKVTKKDYSAIQVLLDEANEALGGFTQGISAAGLSVSRVMSAN